ncbi:hypothetical protein B5F40_02950 [Gordonibacter sp. An230]|uniref:glycosyltransferase n=1 Tax=Gordonibacter sp. An230 TaxID=1965592 RepID=UPI000B380349|nr:glycosyltransferase [Gordonibacter sp. An230]OUO91806.1 hypothetical protein B5F40_02950 [Gordonibacter sp. An230]
MSDFGRMRHEVCVTVCVTAYNHEKYIEQCLDGIIMQETNFAFEVIVHDDASTDGTSQIIGCYKRRYPNKIVTILQAENQFQQGRSILKEFIFPLAKGRYIAFCEGDDYWTDPKKLQKQVEYLDSHADCVAVYHGCEVVDEFNRNALTSRPIYTPRTSGRYTNLDFALGKTYPGQTASLVLRRSVYDGSEEFPIEDYWGLQVNGDAKTLLLCLTKGEVYVIGDVMSVHRVIQTFGSSWSARMFGKNLSGVFYRTHREMRRFAKSRNLSFPNYRKELRCVVSAIAKRVVFKQGQDRDALSLVLSVSKGWFGLLIEVLKCSLLCLPFELVRRVKRIH